jgi:hypothetical protein
MARARFLIFVIQSYYNLGLIRIQDLYEIKLSVAIIGLKKSAWTNIVFRFADLHFTMRFTRVMPSFRMSAFTLGHISLIWIHLFIVFRKLPKL